MKLYDIAQALALIALIALGLHGQEAGFLLLTWAMIAAAFVNEMHD